MSDPLTVTIPEAARMLGVCKRTAYELAARDEFPVPVIRLGRALRVSRTRLEAFVNGEVGSPDSTGAVKA